MKKNNHSHVGFTLIELIISTAIFVTFVTIAITTFVVFLEASVISLRNREAIHTLDVVMEELSREIRLGVDHQCASEFSHTSLTRGIEKFDNDCMGGNALHFIDQSGKITIYSFEGNQLYRAKVEDVDDFETDIFSPLIGPQVHLRTLTFNLVGGGENDRRQPRVHLNLKGDYIYRRGETESFSLRTLVTRRGLQIEGDTEFLVSTEPRRHIIPIVTEEGVIVIPEDLRVYGGDSPYLILLGSNDGLYRVRLPATFNVGDILTRLENNQPSCEECGGVLAIEPRIFSPGDDCYYYAGNNNIIKGGGGSECEDVSNTLLVRKTGNTTTQLNYDGEWEWSRGNVTRPVMFNHNDIQSSRFEPSQLKSFDVSRTGIWVYMLTKGGDLYCGTGNSEGMIEINKKARAKDITSVHTGGRGIGESLIVEQLGGDVIVINDEDCSSTNDKTIFDASENTSEIVLHISRFKGNGGYILMENEKGVSAKEYIVKYDDISRGPSGEIVFPNELTSRLGHTLSLFDEGKDDIALVGLFPQQIGDIRLRAIAASFEGDVVYVLDKNGDVYAVVGNEVGRYNHARHGGRTHKRDLNGWDFYQLRTLTLQPQDT